MRLIKIMRMVFPIRLVRIPGHGYLLFLENFGSQIIIILFMYFKAKVKPVIRMTNIYGKANRPLGIGIFNDLSSHFCGCILKRGKGGGVDFGYSPECWCNPR
jgi:hypothetical protein